MHRPQQIVQVRERGRPDDRRGDAVLGQEPRERGLRHGGADARGDLLEAGDDELVGGVLEEHAEVPGWVLALGFRERYGGERE